MSLKDWITATLAASGSIRSVSWWRTSSQQHFGHAGWREGGETHFRIDVVSRAFEGKSRVERHRVINAALAGAFERGLHALAIQAKAPGE